MSQLLPAPQVVASSIPSKRERESILHIDRASRSYTTPAGEFLALAEVSMTIAAGEIVAIVGASGSGKSTLVNLVAGIDRPSRGTIVIAGTRVDTLGESALARWRGRNVGVVFQFFQLIPTLTAVENVMLPIDFCGTLSLREARARALALLDEVGVADQADKLPAALSGGQEQRVAIARALANDPPVVLADEPTGNLDSRTSEAIVALFVRLADRGKCVVVASHERDIARHVDRVIALADGTIAEVREGGRGHA